MTSLLNNNEDKQSKLGVITAVLCILFNMNTLITNAYFSRTNYAVISTSVILFLFFSFVVFEKRRVNITRSSLFFIAMSAMILLTAFISNELSNILYFVILMELFKAILLSRMISFTNFVKVYRNTIFIMATISIVMFFLCLVAPSILNFAARRRVLSVENGSSVYSFGLYYVLPMAKTRNTGFLSEPGDYQHYLNIALIFDLFIIREKKNKKILSYLPAVVLSIAALTTFSSAGILFLCLIWGAYLLSFGFNSKKLVMVLLLLAAGVALSQVPIFTDGLSYSMDKLSGVSTSSLEVRTLSILSGFVVMLKNPLFGNGINQGTLLLSDYFSSHNVSYNMTSTTSCFFAMFGVFVGIILFWEYIKPFFISLRKNIALFPSLLVLLGIIISINDERLIYELTYYIYVVYGVKEFYGKRKLNK